MGSRDPGGIRQMRGGNGGGSAGGGAWKVTAQFVGRFEGGAAHRPHIQKRVPEIAMTSGTRQSDKGLRPHFSSRGRTRTCDSTVNSRLLYQLSYAGMFANVLN